MIVSPLKRFAAGSRLLLIAANLPVIALAVGIGVNQSSMSDVADRDRLIQAASLVAARATGARTDGPPLGEAGPMSIFRDRGTRSEIAAALVGPDGALLAQDDEVAPAGRDWLPGGGLSKDALAKAALTADERVFRGRGRDGRAYRYAVSPIKGSQAVVVTASPFDLMNRSKTQWLLLALVLPALMILLCVGAGAVRDRTVRAALDPGSARRRRRLRQRRHASAVGGAHRRAQ